MLLGCSPSHWPFHIDPHLMLDMVGPSMHSFQDTHDGLPGFAFVVREDGLDILKDEGTRLLGLDVVCTSKEDSTPDIIQTLAFRGCQRLKTTFTRTTLRMCPDSKQILNWSALISLPELNIIESCIAAPTEQPLQKKLDRARKRTGWSKSIQNCS